MEEERIKEKCPKCETTLKTNNIVQLNGAKIVTVGYELFCTKMGCDYERNI